MALGQTKEAAVAVPSAKPMATPPPAVGTSPPATVVTVHDASCTLRTAALPPSAT